MSAVAPAETEQQRQARKIIETLAELGGGMFADDFVTFQGQKLIIPSNMTIAETIRFLERKLEEEERPTEFNRTFKYRPWDGAWCAWNVLKRTFGSVGHRSKTVMTLFGPEERPPELITLNVDVDKQEQVPWGNLNVPFLPGARLTLTQEMHPEFGPLFKMTAMAPRKYRAPIEGIFKLIESELKENSMYKGKAIDGADMPEFIDLSGVDPAKVIYTDEVTAQLEANVWAPIQYPKEMKKMGSALKRAVLIHGPYGTGKTLAAALTGQRATANGWTYIGARPGRDNLDYVMQTARLYQPAVVFFEDMDKVANPEEAKGDQITMLLDRFDGIQAKNTEIICVLTTNHPDRIHKGMVRPGRLDAVIEIAALDEGGVERLVKSHIREDLLSGDVDWAVVGEAMDGYLPAFIKEGADRSMRYALARAKRDNKDVAQISIDTEDLVYAAQALRKQLDLMNGAKDTHEAESVGAAIARTTRDAVVPLIREDLLSEEGQELIQQNGR